ncbi:unnamed protein product [Heterosigma akashiwo]
MAAPEADVQMADAQTPILEQHLPLNLQRLKQNLDSMRLPKKLFPKRMKHRAFHGLVEEARSLSLTFMETNRDCLLGPVTLSDFTKGQYKSALSQLQNELRERGLVSEEAMPPQQQQQHPQPGGLGAVRGTAGLVGAAAVGAGAGAVGGTSRKRARPAQGGGQARALAPPTTLAENVFPHEVKQSITGAGTAFAAKVKAIQDSGHEFDEHPLHLFNGSDKAFINRCARIQRCLKKHFGSNLSSFLSNWKNRKGGSFTRFACSGKEAACTPPPSSSVQDS